MYGIVLIVGINADVGAELRPATPGMRFICSTIIAALGIQLGAPHFIELQDVVTLVAGVDRAREDRLAVDHGGADDQADRHGELQHHQRRRGAGPTPEFRRRIDWP